MLNDCGVTSRDVEDEEEECVAVVPYWPGEITVGGDEVVDLDNLFSTHHSCQVMQHAEKCSHDCCRGSLSVTPVDAMQVSLGENGYLDVCSVPSFGHIYIHFLSADRKTFSPGHNATICQRKRLYQ